MFTLFHSILICRDVTLSHCDLDLSYCFDDLQLDRARYKWSRLILELEDIKRLLYLRHDNSINLACLFYVSSLDIKFLKCLHCKRLWNDAGIVMIGWLPCQTSSSWRYLMVFICCAWMALLMTNTSLMSSKISGLFLSLIFILSFMAMMIFWVRSSAPCLELFSAAPIRWTETYTD